MTMGHALLSTVRYVASVYAKAMYKNEKINTSFHAIANVWEMREMRFAPTNLIYSLTFIKLSNMFQP